MANKVTQIKNMIYEIRSQKVMLDRDLAGLYGVELKVMNQAVKHNAGRFPSDFMFQLTEEEWKNLRSQIVTFNKDTRKYKPFLGSAGEDYLPRTMRTWFYSCYQEGNLRPPTNVVRARLSISWLKWKKIIYHE